MLHIPFCGQRTQTAREQVIERYISLRPCAADIMRLGFILGAAFPYSGDHCLAVGRVQGMQIIKPRFSASETEEGYFCKGLFVFVDRCPSGSASNKFSCAYNEQHIAVERSFWGSNANLLRHLVPQNAKHSQEVSSARQAPSFPNHSPFWLDISRRRVYFPRQYSPL
jgi:hypothetical protein